MADTVTLPGTGIVASTDEQTIGGTLQHVQLVREYGGNILAGSLGATTTAAALGSAQDCAELLVQNDPDNTVDLLVGDATTQTIQLTPGQSVTIPVKDVSLVRAKTVSGTGAANWLALTKGT